ncbi:MAG: hypothetical protein LBQ44_01975 [Treponema sp.]|jgi:hypothetical protein|nr:hypothetical protein [Treponema sp.]
MLPFYFLSVLLNAAIGYILAFKREETGEDETLNFSLDNQVLRLILGALSMVTGILKVLSPVEGNIPVIGDLVPALANLAGGFILVFEYYRNKSSISTEASEKLGDLIALNRKLAGFVCLGAALSHLLFQQVPLL